MAQEICIGPILLATRTYTRLYDYMMYGNQPRKVLNYGISNESANERNEQNERELLRERKRERETERALCGRQREKRARTIRTLYILSEDIYK